MDVLTSVLVPIHKEGHKFILAFAVATLLLFLIWTPLGWLGVILTAWCIYFFRDPDRLTPIREGLIISPADGVVSLITEAAPPPELGLGDDVRPRISVFMNVFNCHVNRSPVGGTVTRTAYRPGLFLNAGLDKASDDNERHSMVIDTGDGKSYVVVQIAGLVARRIVNEIKDGDALQVGERFGLIRFGSRVDVYLEPGQTPLVSVGQTMIAGETVLVDTKSTEPARLAEIH